MYFCSPHPPRLFLYLFYLFHFYSIKHCSIHIALCSFCQHIRPQVSTLYPLHSPHTITAIFAHTASLALSLSHCPSLSFQQLAEHVLPLERDVPHPPNNALQPPSYLQPCQHGTGRVSSLGPPGETGASTSPCLSAWMCVYTTVCVCVNVCAHTRVYVADTLLFNDQKPEYQMLSFTPSGRGMIQFPISSDYLQMELILHSAFTLYDMITIPHLRKYISKACTLKGHYKKCAYYFMNATIWDILFYSYHYC